MRLSHPHDFITRNLYLLIPFIYFTQLYTPLPSGNHPFVLCICESASVLFLLFLDSKCKWIIWCLSFCLPSLGIISSRSSHGVAHAESSLFFNDWVIKQHRFQLHGSTYTWIFSIKTTVLHNLWLVDSTDAGPWIQRANYGTWAYMDFWYLRQVLEPLPSGYQGTTVYTTVSSSYIHLLMDT